MGQLTANLDAEIEISTDHARLHLDAIYTFLTRQSHWAVGLSRTTFERSIAHSICFGAFDRSLHAGGVQVGFARVETDRATFAYLCDVFVLPPWRGRGIGRQLVCAIEVHPALQGLRRKLLVTRDAHALYKKFDYREAAHPERFMEKLVHHGDLHVHAQAL